MINNVEHLKQFKDIKGIIDIINEINKIEFFQAHLDKKKAKEFLDELSIKYAKERVEYNLTHPFYSNDIYVNLNNARTFLFCVAEKIIMEATLNGKKNEK